MAKKMRLPDFIGIGAHKCGTSWVWKQLTSHPEICGIKKEIAFWIGDIKPIEDYAKWFNDCPRNKLVGEFSPAYLASPSVVKRILKSGMNPLFFAVLRNPIDRAFSEYKHDTFKNAIPKHLTFLEAFNERWPRFFGPNQNLQDKGRYADYLKAWFDAFGRHRVKVFLYDDLVKEPLKFIQDMYSILGVWKNYQPPGYKKEVKKMYNYYYDLNPIKLTNKERNEVKRYYKSSIKSLEVLLERDLSFWLK
jgi:Sulfotransferase domain